jgi:hypothetical protein
VLRKSGGIIMTKNERMILWDSLYEDFESEQEFDDYYGEGTLEELYNESIENKLDNDY